MCKFKEKVVPLNQGMKESLEGRNDMHENKNYYNKAKLSLDMLFHLFYLLKILKGCNSRLNCSLQQPHLISECQLELVQF